MKMEPPKVVPSSQLRAAISFVAEVELHRASASGTLLHSVTDSEFPDCDYIILSVFNADYIIPRMATKLWLKDIVVSCPEVQI